QGSWGGLVFGQAGDGVAGAFLALREVRAAILEAGRRAGVVDGGAVHIQPLTDGCEARYGFLVEGAVG
nr:hypothetical protein [Tanacetum cinerariifolium]